MTGTFVRDPPTVDAAGIDRVVRRLVDEHWWMSQDEREASDPAAPSPGFGSLTVDETRLSLDTKLGRGLDPRKPRLV